jgi:hypothetical protein
MATGSIHSYETRGFDSSALARLFAGPIRFSSFNTLSETFPFLNDNNRPYVSTRSALSGARAAITAIGLEALAALFLFGIWEARHLFR